MNAVEFFLRWEQSLRAQHSSLMPDEGVSVTPKKLPWLAKRQNFPSFYKITLLYRTQNLSLARSLFHQVYFRSEWEKKF